MQQNEFLSFLFEPLFVLFIFTTQLLIIVFAFHYEIVLFFLFLIHIAMELLISLIDLLAEHLLYFLSLHFQSLFTLDNFKLQFLNLFIFVLNSGGFIIEEIVDLEYQFLSFFYFAILRLVVHLIRIGLNSLLGLL